MPASEKVEGRFERSFMTETAQAPWALVDRTDLVPGCPHCDEPLNEVYWRGSGFPLGQGRTLVYFCPGCLKALGFAQGRVF
jgi:hypothetical protein